MVFVVEGLTTNILPTNEATLPTFTCSASSNHENITHEMSQYCWTTKIFPPEITRYMVIKQIKKSMNLIKEMMYFWEYIILLS